MVTPSEIMVDGVRVRIINPEAIPVLERKVKEFILKYEPLRRQKEAELMAEKNKLAK